MMVNINKKETRKHLCHELKRKGEASLIHGWQDLQCKIDE